MGNILINGNSLGAITDDTYTNTAGVLGSIPTTTLAGKPLIVSSAIFAYNGSNFVPLQYTANGLKVDGSAVTQPISASSLPLPTGAATAALQTQPGVDIGDVTINNASGANAVNIQDGGNSITIDGTVTANLGTIADVSTETTLSAINTKIPSNPSTDRTTAVAPFSTRLSDGTSFYKATTPSDTQPISAASLPLPTGAATAALQTQPGVDIGDVTINNASGVDAVNIQDGGNSITVDGTVAATQSGTWTVQPGNTANTTPWAQNITQVGGSSLTLGQKTSANSVPVVLPSDQTISVSGGGDPTKLATYSASIVGLSAANNATDIFTVTGSASKTIKIHHIVLGGTRTSTNLTDLVFLKRSTANTGGTSTTLTNVSHDSNDAAGTATVRAYTANPTTGTLVGNLAALKAPFTATATALDVTTEVEYGLGNRRAIVLRGVNEVFAINLNGVTVAGNSINITIEWSEE